MFLLFIRCSSRTSLPVACRLPPGTETAPRGMVRSPPEIEHQHRRSAAWCSAISRKGCGAPGRGDSPLRPARAALLEMRRSARRTPVRGAVPAAARQLSPAADIAPQMLTAALCRFCCKSPFALVIKISFGCTRDFRVKMWGTSSPDDKLTDGLRNAIEGTRISGRRWSFLTAEKLAPCDLGLLQQYLPITDFGRLRGRITPL